MTKLKLFYLFSFGSFFMITSCLDEPNPTVTEPVQSCILISNADYDCNGFSYPVSNVRDGKAELRI